MRLVFETMNPCGRRYGPVAARALTLAVALLAAMPHRVQAQPAGAPAAAAASVSTAAPAPLIQGAPAIAAPAPVMQGAPAAPPAAEPGPITVPSTAAPAETAAAVPASTLPHDLSFSSMFLDATPVVKGVILALVLASLVTWTVWLAKALELGASRRSLRRALNVLSAATSLADVAKTGDRTVDALLREATLELGQSKDLPEANVSGRIAARLERVQAAASRRALIGTNVLATIGSSAPFVGLFGTVWGIMASFISISQAQTTNLMVVAPGIAEALLATAFGLIAAIPAGIIYNAFARIIAGHRGLFGDAATLVLCLAGRDLDRRALNLAA
jgi:biopolymer transport protein ExbB